MHHAASNLTRSEKPQAKTQILQNKLSCLNCGSRFFKTLETKILEEFSPNRLNTEKAEKNIVLLYKKRCKGCKFKFFFQKSETQGPQKYISYETWRQGKPIDDMITSSGLRLFTSEYSKKISRNAEDNIPYLKQLSRLNRSKLKD